MSRIDFSQTVTAEQKAAEAQAALVAAIRSAVDAHVEATARSRGYNSAAHIATYVASTVPAWANEAQAFVAWRDSVWLAVFEAAPNVGQISDPGAAMGQLLAALPAITWPEE